MPWHGRTRHLKNPNADPDRLCVGAHIVVSDGVTSWRHRVTAVTPRRLKVIPNDRASYEILRWMVRVESGTVFVCDLGVDDQGAPLTIHRVVRVGTALNRAGQEVPTMLEVQLLAVETTLAS